ncbi:MAG: hypothetical protein IT306_02980 [Chloroflexi bacterium]|nr:hypothetical protein [Chloroflexota bacterium]
MSWRQLPAITLILLGILLAAPLSSGDKGLWLSVAPTAALLSDAPAGGLPAEHSTILPDASSRSAAVGRTESSGAGRGPDADAVAPRLPAGERWISSAASRSAEEQQALAAPAAPRAPPA